MNKIGCQCAQTAWRSNRCFWIVLLLLFTIETMGFCSETGEFLHVFEIRILPDGELLGLSQTAGGVWLVWTVPPESQEMKIVYSSNTPLQTFNLVPGSMRRACGWSEMDTSRFPPVQDFLFLPPDVLAISALMGDRWFNSIPYDCGGTTSLIAIFENKHCFLLEQSKGSSWGVAGWKPFGKFTERYVLCDFARESEPADLAMPPILSAIGRKTSPLFGSGKNLFLLEEIDLKASSARQLALFRVAPFEIIQRVRVSGVVRSLSQGSHTNEIDVMSVVDSKLKFGTVSCTEGDASTIPVTVSFLDELDEDAEQIAAAQWSRATKSWCRSDEPSQLLTKRSARPVSALAVDNAHRFALDEERGILVTYGQEDRFTIWSVYGDACSRKGTYGLVHSGAANSREKSRGPGTGYELVRIDE